MGCLSGERHLEDTTQHPRPAGPVPSQRGRSSSQTKGPRRKKPIFRFIEGGKGAGEGSDKCFCFIYKSDISRRLLLKEEGATSSPTTSSSKAKPRRGKGNWGGQGTPNTPLKQRPRAFSPHPQCVYPRGPIWDEDGSMYTGGGGTGLGKGGNNLSAAAVGGKGTGGSRLVAVVV